VLAEGTTLPNEVPEAAPNPILEALRQVLRESPAPLTRQEILDRWPEAEPRPTANGLWRVLVRGCEMGIMVCSGKGTRAEAFRYSLAPPQPGACPLQSHEK